MKPSFRIETLADVVFAYRHPSLLVFWLREVFMREKLITDSSRRWKNKLRIQQVFIAVDIFQLVGCTEIK